MEIYLPLDTIDIWQLTKYEKLTPSPSDPNVSEIHQTLGLVRDGRFHPYRGFNKFLKESWPLPPWPEWSNMLDVWIEQWKEWKKDGVTTDSMDVFISKAWDQKIKYWQRHVFDPQATTFVPQLIHPFCLLSNAHTLFRTEDNMGTAFLVLMGDNVCYILGRTDDVVEHDRLDNRDKAPDQCQFPFPETPIYPEWQQFTKIIATYHMVKYFVGSSPLNEMTKYSGGHGEKWTGNSLLLQIAPVRYVFIGWNVYEFDSHEPIVNYVSSVGNNRVPYPYAETENWYLDLTNEYKILKMYATDTPKKGYVCGESTQGQPIDNMSIIASRDTDRERCPPPPQDDYTCADRSHHQRSMILHKAVEFTHCANTSQ